MRRRSPVSGRRHRPIGSQDGAVGATFRVAPPPPVPLDVLTRVVDARAAFQRGGPAARPIRRASRARDRSSISGICQRSRVPITRHGRSPRRSRPQHGFGWTGVVDATLIGRAAAALLPNALGHRDSAVDEAHPIGRNPAKRAPCARATASPREPCSSNQAKSPIAFAIGDRPLNCRFETVAGYPVPEHQADCP